MKRWILLMAVAAVVIGIGTLYGTGNLKAVESYASGFFKKKPKPPQQQPPPAVTVIHVTPRDFVETVQLTGTLVPREQVLVAPEIDGQRILDVLVDEGDIVRKGQVLARLVSVNVDAQIAQNSATTDRAKAAIAQARSAIAQAKADLTRTETALGRAARLKTSGNISQSAYDDRLAAAKTARAQYSSAVDGLRAAKAEVAQLQARLKELEWRRRNTTVRAPTDGIVSRRNARIGALASAAAAPMFQIIRDGKIELDGEVTADQLMRIRQGQDATVSVTGIENLSGTIRLISPEVDRTTRLGRIRIALPPSSNLRIGVFARAHVRTAASNGLSVPLSAVMYDGDTRYVLVVRDGVARRRDITIGLQHDGNVEVRTGLMRNAVVIAKAGTFLRDGDQVRPLPTRNARTSEAN